MKNTNYNISTNTIAEQTYQIIKDKILIQEYLPGMRLKDDEISKDLNISKTPIRQALNRLESEGLVQINPRSGTYVREFCGKDIWEIFTIRESLEVLALDLSWGKLDKAFLFNLKDRMIKARKNIEDKNNTNMAVKIDHEFHDFITYECANNMLINLLKEVHNLAYYFMVNQAKNLPDYKNACEQHIEIIDAILNDEKERAKYLLKEHIASVRKRLESQNHKC